MDTEVLLRRRFAARLQEAMDARGWNQTELGKRSDLSQSSIHDMLDLERADGPAIPNGVTLSALCRELRVSADWLLGLGRNPQGGVPSAGETYQDGGTAAIIEMQLALERLRDRWRGATTLPTDAERASGAEQLALKRDVGALPQRRRTRRKRA